MSWLTLVSMAAHRTHLIWLAAGITLISAPATDTQGQVTPAGSVRVATTGNHSEERETIPVTQRERAERKVAISMSPGEMPSLREGDRVRITAEVEVTNNCRHASTTCISRPYSYDPKIGTQMVLANDPNVVSGPGARALTGRREFSCRQHEPNREHHCLSIYRHVSLQLDDARRLPCRLEDCHINLVADASNSRARRGDVVILGVDRTGHRIHQDRGRINVTRFRGQRVTPRVRKTDARLTSSVDVEKRAAVSIYSLKLEGLTRGDQLAFDASATFDVDHLPYSVFTGSQLIVARKAGGTRTTPLTRNATSLHGQINEQMGFNCTQLTTPCAQPRVGVLKVRRTPQRDGRIVPLYVNYVFRNAPKRVTDRPGDEVEIRPGGGIVAWTY